ncbi:MAG: hypothetical protein LBI16_03180 [Burkholderiales bacterium]|nr:hypothetical protein [Burkholderiales bacterium]
MNTEESLFPEDWRAIAEDLGLEIISPFDLILLSGTCVRVPVLLRNFGGSVGMLLVADFSTIAPFVDEIDYSLYGYSTLSEPTKIYDKNDIEGREAAIEMLEEWGWTGEKGKEPEWYK